MLVDNGKGMELGKGWLKHVVFRSTLTTIVIWPHSDAGLNDVPWSGLRHWSAMGRLVDGPLGTPLHDISAYIDYP